MQAEQGSAHRDHQRPQHKAAVAAHRKDAQPHALVRTGNAVGVARALGMEKGGPHAADHEAEKDGPVIFQIAGKAHAQPCQQNAQRHKPRATAPVSHEAEEGLHNGRDHGIGKHESAGRLIVEAVHGRQIRQKRRQGTAVYVARHVPHRDDKKFPELHGFPPSRQIGNEHT